MANGSTGKTDGPEGQTNLTPKNQFVIASKLRSRTAKQEISPVNTAPKEAKRNPAKRLSPQNVQEHVLPMVRCKEAETVKKLQNPKSAAQHKKDDLVHLQAELEAKLAWVQGKSGMPEKDLAAKAIRAWLLVIKELTLAQRVCIPTAN